MRTGAIWGVISKMLLVSGKFGITWTSSKFKKFLENVHFESSGAKLFECMYVCMYMCMHVCSINLYLEDLIKMLFHCVWRMIGNVG